MAGLRFRGALLKVCRDMGEETWGNFCFLFDVPESKREKYRGEVLTYLMDSGAVSVEKPGDLAALLRDHLKRDDLARIIIDECGDAGDQVVPAAEVAHVETRAKTNRRSHSPDRRHAKLFALPLDLEDSTSSTQEERTPTEADGDGVLRRRLRPDNFADSRRINASMHDTSDVDTDYRQIFATLPRMQRNNSSLSQYSNRSSGYFSWRSSTARASVISLQSIPNDDETRSDSSFQVVPDTQCTSLGQLQPMSESSTELPRPSLDRLASSSSSEDDYQSCSSGSTENLLTASTKENAECEECLTDYPFALRGRGRKNSPEVIDSPTYSSLRKKITVQMCLDQKDLLHDIEKKRTKKLYRSFPPFPCCKDGLQFQLRFYPTNLEQSGAALYIDIVSLSENLGTSVPPLDITVSVCDSKQLSQYGDTCTSERDCIAFEQRDLKGGLLSNGHCITNFPRLVDHTTLRSVAGSAMVIEVVMEYPTPLNPIAAS